VNPLPVTLLAIDPSSTKIGWALIGPGPSYLASNVCYIAETAPPHERVALAGEAVNQIINDCRQRGYFPAIVVIEVPDFIAAYARPHIIVYWRAVGAVEYATRLANIPVATVAASEDKRRTRKADGKARFCKLVGRYPWTDDESDALCIGWDYLVALMAQPRPPAAP
jgi:Holliday junction resolvasome RuvABC endonuclease subunit